jgi:hypothetical protein
MKLIQTEKIFLYYFKKSFFKKRVKYIMEYILQK